MAERASRPVVIAHRGYSAVAPENTLAALTAALDAGAEAVQVDVQTAFDGTPVLFHDVHLGRTSSGVGPLRRRTVGQLQALDAGSWFGEGFGGEKIPTLAEALDLLRDRVEAFYPEVKGYREMEDLDRMVAVTRSSGLLARTTFLSMDWIILDRIRQTEPSVELGYVVDEEDSLSDAVQRCQSDGHALVELEAGLALDRPELLQSALDEGVEVGVWNVDRPDDAQRLWEGGVTRFTTNEVADLLAWARGR